ncbi:MAG: carboxypeptidase regulatory-like domain-containing protein [Halieaceae bacterium]|jgi:hypothetical protein|nr:carboxypeptidase regulatory-like domain-containing protein [Halieaceae bacterium]
MQKHLATVASIIFSFLPLQVSAKGNINLVLPSQPNHYVFAGKNVSVEYTTSSIDDTPQLHYRRGSNGVRTFSGDEIRATKTEVGQLVTLSLRQIPDLKTTTFTLLIPAVNVNEQGPVLFETTAFITNHHTTIAGPALVDGPIQTHFMQSLLAQASQVDLFPTQETGIIGKLSLSPTCPGPLRPGQICIGPFADATVELIDDMDQVVGTAITNSQGLFIIRADPGNYTVDVVRSGGFPHCPPTAVKIPDGVVSVRFTCNTGLR